MKKILDVKIGDTFGDFLCVGINKYKKIGNKYVMKCSICGREKEMLSSTIRTGHGIYHKSCGKGIKTKDKIFYDRWQAMRTRTTNPNYQHADCYSGREIKSDAFENFIDFYDSMYESWLEESSKYGKNNTSLERINFDKDYTPDNCIWIYKNDQQKNSRKIVNFEVEFPDGHKEIRKNVNEFAKEYGLDANTILDVMNPKKATSQHKGYKFKRL